VSPAAGDLTPREADVLEEARGIGPRPTSPSRDRVGRLGDLAVVGLDRFGGSFLVT